VLGGAEAQAKLREVFGDGLAYRDVPGLCKAASISEIEAQGWSLNAGRYVGVEGNDTDMADFSVAYGRLSAELQSLTSSARFLEQRIAENAATLLGS